MRHFPHLSRLILVLVFAACTEDQPSAPSPSGGRGGPVFDHAAGHLVVNSTADPGVGGCTASQCTLREAIRDPRSTEISFASGLSGPITLAKPSAGGGGLIIDKSLTITGPNGGITVQRLSSDPRFRILTISRGATVQISNLTVRRGNTDRPGGGIMNFGSLRLTHCRVVANRGLHGGGIDNHGPLRLENVALLDNLGLAGLDNHDDMPAVISNSSFVRNAGRGIFNRGGDLQISNSAVSHNAGQGIRQEWGQATLDRVRVVGNASTGVSNFQGRVTITNSTVALNTTVSGGGGISNSGAGRIDITSSTISGNNADEGGGISNTVGDPFGRLRSRIRLINSTVSGNSARMGGGIQNADDRGGAGIEVTNSTIAGNSATEEGGGVHNRGRGSDSFNSVFLVNSLVAHNISPSGPDAVGPTARYSVIGDGTGSGVSNTDGNQVGNVDPYTSAIDPKLGPLADNGGPTRTHALLSGSPAIDAASGPECPSTDQRGVARPQGPECDIGSYERE